MPSQVVVADCEQENDSRVLDLSRDVRDSVAALLMSKGVLDSLDGGRDRRSQGAGPSLASALDVQGMVVYPHGKESLGGLGDLGSDLLPMQHLTSIMSVGSTEEVPPLLLPPPQLRLARKRTAEDMCAV